MYSSSERGDLNGGFLTGNFSKMDFTFFKLTQMEYLYPACYSWSKATRDLLVIRYQAPYPISEVLLRRPQGTLHGHLNSMGFYSKLDNLIIQFLKGSLAIFDASGFMVTRILKPLSGNSIHKVRGQEAFFGCDR